MKIIQTVCSCLVGMAFLLLSRTIFAETPWDALVKFGLTGTWAKSCNVAPSPSAFWQTFFRDDNGHIRERLDRGPDAPPLTSTIDTARLITPTKLELIYRNDDPNFGSANGRTFDVILIKENGRIRTLESKTTDGTEYAKDCINLSTGQPTAWLEKCRN